MQVPFHGRTVRGWVLGTTDDLPTRMLPVKKVVSPVRFFDERMLRLLRWASERYVAPLAAVIARSHPPRVVSEEAAREAAGPATPVGIGLGKAAGGAGTAPHGATLSYRGGTELLGAIARGEPRSFVLRPAPEDEQGVALEAVDACLRGGRRAIVLAPEADPIPATAAALVAAFGQRVGLYLGGDRRERYRTWLALREGRYDVVVGTRPAVFASVPGVGMLYVSRESHPAHREDRAPYYHVREVALARARIEGATCVLSSVCPSTETAELGLPEVSPASRRWPPVEVVKPGPEGRAPRLLRALKEARRAFVYAPVPGSGVARVCRACREPAACAACGGMLRQEEGVARCTVCEAPGRCANCGASDFGVRPGGAERVEKWARRAAASPVRRYAKPRLPGGREVVIGGPDAVRDLGPGDLDLVAILDADLAGRRPGLGARERALVTWFEAAGWARPHGRVIAQASDARDPAIQALVRGKPDRFHVDEARRRRAAGFPVGSAVFRVAGGEALAAALEPAGATTLLVTGSRDQTVCLLALAPGRVAAFGVLARKLAAQGMVDRVEAEPHL